MSWLHCWWYFTIVISRAVWKCPPCSFCTQVKKKQMWHAIV
jgi:hypothetical protein